MDAFLVHGDQSVCLYEIVYASSGLEFGATVSSFYPLGLSSMSLDIPPRALFYRFTIDSMRHLRPLTHRFSIRVTSIRTVRIGPASSRTRPACIL